MNERPLAETLGEFAVGFDLHAASQRAVVLSPVRVDAVAELVLNLATVADVRDIARLLATSAPHPGLSSPSIT